MGSRDNLFSLIRKEELVIWAGAGLSSYAGFPSGKRLGEILFESLSLTEQQQISRTLSLSELAEYFYRIKGHKKNSLINVLIKTFLDHTPISTSIHDKLALISHVKTIITTNYDRLLENSFGQNSQVIYSVNQLTYMHRDKTQIFKMHGDLSDPDSIIITKSDYNRFFKESLESNLLWTVVKERLTTNNVLFLGYDLEDPNISVLLDKLSDELKDHRKEFFLVAPDLSELKVNDLIVKGIQYINSTAEKLIDELIDNIKDNIVQDLHDGHVTADTFRNFCKRNGLVADLKGTKESFKLLSLNGIEKSVVTQIKFKIKNEDNFIGEFRDFIDGKKIGKFLIPKKNLLAYDITTGGLRIPSSEGVIFKFESLPIEKTMADIRFDDGFELSEIPIEIYKSKSGIEFHLKIKTALLKFFVLPKKSPTINFRLEFERDSSCGKTKDEIEFYTFLVNVSSGKSFKVFDKSGKTFSNCFPVIKSLLKESEVLLNYFLNLKTIEKHYNIQFMNFPMSSITDESFHLVKCVIIAIQGNQTIVDWYDEMEMTINGNPEEALEKIVNIDDGIATLTVVQCEEEIVDLHGLKLNLGFRKAEFIDPYISNRKLIELGDVTKAVVKSRSNKIKVTYFKEKFWERDE